MRTFELYSPAGTQSEGFFNQPLLAGAMAWIESKGFSSGFFKDRQSKDLLQFAVLNGGAASLPRDPASFEKLPFVEAEIIEANEGGAKVVVRSATTLGEWARSVYTLGKSNVLSIPEESRPGPAVLEPLYEAFRAKESVVWNADAVPTDAVSPLAVYLFKCEFDKRCMVLTSSAGTSYLVKL